MSFLERHGEIVKKVGPQSILRLTVETIIFSLIIFVGVVIYNYFYNHAFGLSTINSSLALTAVIIIGFSFALSGLCYFWDFVDTKIIYRKYLGLTGFGFGLLHAVISFILYLPSLLNRQETYAAIYDVYHQWDVFGLSINNFYALLSGIIALAIFIMMASISNKYAVQELGGRRWRGLLRLGYLAYVLVIFHFGIKKAHLWVDWVQNFSGLPPPSLPLVFFALTVFILRIALWRDLRQKKNKAQQEIIEDSITELNNDKPAL